MRLPTGSRRQVHTETRVGVETVVARVVYWVFGVIEALLALRFLLKLGSANTAAPFVRFVYDLSRGLMDPFYRVFPTMRVERIVFDWSILLAMLVYALVAWGIVALIYAVNPRQGATTVEEESKADDTEHRSGQAA